MLVVTLSGAPNHTRNVVYGGEEQYLFDKKSYLCTQVVIYRPTTSVYIGMVVSFSVPTLYVWPS